MRGRPSFKEGLRVTVRLCRAAATGTRLADEIRRHEHMLAAEFRQQTIEHGVAAEEEQQARLEGELASLPHTPPQRTVMAWRHNEG